jgi:hypothetical protein
LKSNGRWLQPHEGLPAFTRKGRVGFPGVPPVGQASSGRRKRRVGCLIKAEALPGHSAGAKRRPGGRMIAGAEAMTRGDAPGSGAANAGLRRRAEVEGHRDHGRHPRPPPRHPAAYSYLLRPLCEPPRRLQVFSRPGAPPGASPCSRDSGTTRGAEGIEDAEFVRLWGAKAVGWCSRLQSSSLRASPALGEALAPARGTTALLPSSGR